MVESWDTDDTQSIKKSQHVHPRSSHDTAVITVPFKPSDAVNRKVWHVIMHDSWSSVCCQPAVVTRPRATFRCSYHPNTPCEHTLAVRAALEGSATPEEVVDEEEEARGWHAATDDDATFQKAPEVLSFRPDTAIMEACNKLTALELAYQGRADKNTPLSLTPWGDMVR